MPKILITGNGFDLKFNLPTTYFEFIKILSYLENNDKYDFESIYSNSKNFENIKNSFNESIEFDSLKINELKGLISENLWFQFFKNELNIDTWIDFENKINYVLKLFLSAISIINENFFNKGPIGLQLFGYESSALNNNVEIIKVLSFFRILSSTQDSYNWSFLEKFLIKKYNFYVALDIQKINDFLNNQLIDFKNIFNKYFTLFVLPLYEHNQVKYDETLLKHINYYFTFNYTPTFEYFYKSKVKSNYLHGKINSENNSIVLGINDVPEKTNNKIYYLPFTKYYQKLNNNTDFYFLNEISSIGKNSYAESYLFFFWGHSLDKSDEDYINEIFDFVSNSKSKVLKIVIVYHNEFSKSKLLLNILDIRGKDDISKKMRNKQLVFCKDDSEELRKLINQDISYTGMTVSVF